MLKLSENPPMLPPGVEGVEQLSGQWWVAHTKARFEKAFAWDLHHKGVGYFLPLVERVRASRGRKRRVLLPLFPSYVFFRGDSDSRALAMKTNRLCQTIEVRDQQTLTGELASIEKALAGKAALDPCPFARVGARCRVRSGPLEGIEGEVVRREKLVHVVLAVSILGQGALVKIEADFLEPVD